MIYSCSGNTDIQDGNVKLILGLIWSLIAHYQLGASNFPPKKLMLAWLKVEIELRVCKQPLQNTLSVRPFVREYAVQLARPRSSC